MKLLQQGAKESKIPSPCKLTLLQQGAEAKIFLDEKNNLILKNRISKSYRHPGLDKQIIKQRIKAEAKLLIKSAKVIDVPLILEKDFKKSSLDLTNSQRRSPTKSASKQPISRHKVSGNYQIKMPFINGKKLSEHLDKFPLKEQKQIMKLIGTSIAKLHKEDIIHGDLTTSNMILVSNNKSAIVEPPIEKSSLNLADSQQRTLPKAISKPHQFASKASVYFIDFGLGYISKKIEDKAVDLHLLKQALEAKHFKYFKELQNEVFKSYEKENSEAKKIFERITAVERRGRYRH